MDLYTVYILESPLFKIQSDWVVKGYFVSDSQRFVIYKSFFGDDKDIQELNNSDGYTHLRISKLYI